jgi:integrase
MPTTKITKETVKTAEARSQRYIIFDATVPGFGLRVFPSGKKSWIFAYRPHPGGAGTPKKTALIGTVDDFTPDAARKVADAMRVTVKTGGDPQAAKVDERKAVTVKELAADFIARHVTPKRAASTAILYQDALDRIVVPKLGARKARAVKGHDIAALHQELADTPYQANRVLAIISAMYGWAASRPVALVPEGTNPTRGLERFSEKRRGDVLPFDDLARLFATIRQAETEGLPWKLNPSGKVKHLARPEARVTKIGSHAAAAMRLLIFTGMRLREVLNLRWTDIDFERGLIVLETHKTARKTGAKAIVLNSYALDILGGIERVGVYVIAGENAGQEGEKPRPDLKRPWAMVRAAAGLSDLRLHDLRHNFGGFGAGAGLGLPIIGKLLGHTQPQTTDRYSHLDSDPVRRATNAIGNRLAEAMREPKPGDGRNVVPLKRGGA